MNKKHKLIYLLLTFILLFSTAPFQFTTLAHADTESVNKSYHSENPYIQVYKNSLEQTVIKQNPDPLVDPEVENRTILSTLELYYELDKKVSDLLSTYYQDATTSEEIVSVHRKDKINAMNKIMKIYDSVEDEKTKELLLDYLDRYAIGPNDINEEVLSFLDKKTEKEKPVELSAAYNGEGAADWAYNNYDSYRRDYPRFTGEFGSDCTNFVSQAIHIGGGKPKAGNWYVYRKNLKYWEINSAYELDYSWDLSDPSPWISVREFVKYWRTKSGVVFYLTEYYKKNHKKIYTTTDIDRGDVIIFYKGIANVFTVPTHAMINSKKDSKNYDFKLAGHSNERQAYPLLKAIESYAEIEVLKIK